MDDNTKKMLMAAGVGVGATGAIATAMYFLGGREAPKMPSLTGIGDFAKREVGFGAVFARTPDRGILFLFDTEAEAERFYYSLTGEGIGASPPFEYAHKRGETTKHMWAVKPPRSLMTEF